MIDFIEKFIIFFFYLNIISFICVVVFIAFLFSLSLLSFSTIHILCILLYHFLGQIHVIRESYTKGSNDSHVTTLWPNSCPLDQWQCDNFQCISRESLCDGYVHCSDGSDESRRECEKTGNV